MGIIILNMSGSGQPDLCVDIFSHMRSLLASFNNNLANGNSETFSHEDGFATNTGEQPVSSGGNFEQTVDDFSFMLFVGAMVLFLLYSQLSGYLARQQTTNKYGGLP